MVLVEQLRVLEPLGAKDRIQESVRVIGRIDGDRLCRFTANAKAVLGAKLRKRSFSAGFGPSHR